jgi:hypothetical protein
MHSNINNPQDDLQNDLRDNTTAMSSLYHIGAFVQIYINNYYKQ